MSIENVFSYTKLMLLEKETQEEVHFQAGAIFNLHDLLTASIHLVKNNALSGDCLRFYKYALPLSTKRLLQSTSVSNWKPDIQRTILHFCKDLLELLVIRLEEEENDLLDLLYVILDPRNCLDSLYVNSPSINGGSAIFTKESTTPTRHLRDLINHFGSLGGFELLQDKLHYPAQPEVKLITALIQPFAACKSLLSDETLQRYLIPLLTRVPSYLKSLQPNKLYNANEEISIILKALQELSSVSLSQTSHKEMVQKLKLFDKQLSLRNLLLSLNDKRVSNEVLAFLMDGLDRHFIECSDSQMNEKSITQICFAEFLLQPESIHILKQMVELKIKNASLTSEDIDELWNAQFGIHESDIQFLLIEIIFLNKIDDLLRKFIISLSSTDVDKRPTLMRLIKGLHDLDNQEIVRKKVLHLLWTSCDTRRREEMINFIQAHVEILDWSSGLEIEKNYWLQICINEIYPGATSLIPALKLIKEICIKYPSPSNIVLSHSEPIPAEVVSHFNVSNNSQGSHDILVQVVGCLTSNFNAIEGNDQVLFSNEEIQDLLNFVQFILNYGSLWLLYSPASRLWKCLINSSEHNREICFKWFMSLMMNEPDLNPDEIKDFFIYNVLDLHPNLLTPAGFQCFHSFFTTVNYKEGKLSDSPSFVKDFDLIGIEYLWRIIQLSGSEEIVSSAIELLRKIYTRPDPSMFEQSDTTYKTILENLFDKFLTMNSSLV